MRPTNKQTPKPTTNNNNKKQVWGSRMGQWHIWTVGQEISFPEVSLFSRVPIRRVYSIFHSDPDCGLVNVQELLTRERSVTKHYLGQIFRCFVEVGQWVQRVKQNTYEAKRIWCSVSGLVMCLSKSYGAHLWAESFLRTQRDRTFSETLLFFRSTDLR